MFTVVPVLSQLARHGVSGAECVVAIHHVTIPAKTLFVEVCVVGVIGISIVSKSSQRDGQRLVRIHRGLEGCRASR